MTDAERAELAALRAKLNRRKAVAGFKQNVREIEQRIAELAALEGASE
jgi:hypothetical protein